MDCSSRYPHSEYPKPKRLTALASSIKFQGNNTLLHQFVLENSHPNKSGSANYINAVLLSMSDVPANELNDEGYSALHLAVLKKNLLMVEKLLSCLVTIDVNATCSILLNKSPCYTENAAVRIAAQSGNVSIIHKILFYLADRGMKNSETPLCLALSSRDLDVMKMLVSNGANVNLGCAMDTPLCHAVSSGNLEAVEFLVCSGADVNFRGGWTPLMHAAGSGNLAIVKYLVSKGADVNIETRGGESPLHLAARSASLAIVEYFIMNGVDINSTDRNGETPLHHAVKDRRLENVAFLLYHGADINAKGVSGRTPLHYAVDSKYLAVVAFLLDQGAHMQADRDGWTPLHLAAHEGHVDIMRVLLDKGADVNAKNKNGDTPLDLARNPPCIDALQNMR